MVKRPVVLEVPLVLDSFYLISFLQFLLPFSRKRLLLRWIVDIVKGIRSSLEELGESRGYFFYFWLVSQHLLLCNVMKTCRVFYYNNFKVVKEFKPESKAELQQLDIIFAEITSPYWSKNFILFLLWTTQ